MWEQTYLARTKGLITIHTLRMHIMAVDMPMRNGATSLPSLARRKVELATHCLSFCKALSRDLEVTCSSLCKSEGIVTELRGLYVYIRLS